MPGDDDDDTGTSIPSGGNAPAGEPERAPAGAEPSDLPPVTDEEADHDGDLGEVAGGGEITDLGGDSPSS